MTGPLEKPQSPWLRRGLAFLVDYSIYLFAWTIISNLIVFPVPDIILTLASVLLFCGYFGWTEGRGVNRASLGKRVCRLCVLSSEDENPGLQTVIARSLILAALIVFDWSGLLGFLPLPIFVFAIIWGIPSGLAVYNGWLSIFSLDRLMLQDRLTSTKVILFPKVRKKWVRREPAPPEPISKFPRPFVASGFVLAAVLYSLASAFFAFSYLGGQNVWSFPDRAALDINTIMEKHIATETGIRARVNITDKYEKTYLGKDSDSPRTRSLEVKIWVPFVSWSESTRKKFAENALTPLSITVGYYDSGSLVIWTGSEYFNISRTYELTLPE